MRLSFTKKLILTFGVTCLVAVVLAVCLVVSAPREEALAADGDLKLLDYASQPVEYGNLINSVDEEGKIYGLLKGTGTPNQFQVKSKADGGDHYILAADFKVCRSDEGPSGEYTPTLVPLCDALGRVSVDVYYDYKGNIGKYYLTYAGTVPTLFEKIPVYNAEGTAVGYQIASLSNTQQLYFQVKPRKVKVAYDVRSHKGSGDTGDPLATDIVDGVTYIQHTYGDTPDTIIFAEQEDSQKVMRDEFKDVLKASNSFANNNATAHVGYYPIESLDLTVTRQVAGVDVDKSGNYRFVTRDEDESELGTGYGIQVVPRPVEIASFIETRAFATDTDTYTDLFSLEGTVSGTFTSQGFGRDCSAEADILGQKVTVFFDVVREQENLWDKDKSGNDREGVVAITRDEAVWTLDIVGWSVANSLSNPIYDEDYVVAASDYIVRKAAEDTTYALKVEPRAITLYKKTPGGEDKPDNWIDVDENDIEISRPYGDVYSGEESHDITIGNIPVTLTFEVKYEGVALSEYLASVHEEGIRLPVGTYEIISPKVTDDHYVVTVDDSMHWWTVTQKEIGYDELVAWGIAEGAYVASNAKNAKASEKEMYAFLGENAEGICIQEYAYDAERTSITRAYTFVDADTADSVTCEMTVEANLPGYYALVFTAANYVVAADTLYVRISPVEVTVVAPANAVYNGEAFAATLMYDGAETNPFETYGWTAAATYKGDTPKNVGDYSASATITGTDGGERNPYLVYKSKAVSFSIAPMDVTVRLKNNSQLTRTFYAPTQKLTFNSVTLAGNDKISLTSAGLDRSVKPGNYRIEVVMEKGSSSINNYKFAIVDANGRANPSVRVNKIALDDVKDYFNEFLAEQEGAVETNSILLEDIQYYGVDITNEGNGVYYQYTVSDGTEWVKANPTISGLAEGRRFRVRIVIDPDCEYIDTDAPYATESRDFITAIISPHFSQDYQLSTGHSVTVNIADVDRRKQYACVAYDTETKGVPVNVLDVAIYADTEDGVFNIGNVYQLVLKEGNYTLVGPLEPLKEGKEYRVVVAVKTVDSAAVSEPIVVKTRASAPSLSTSSFTVSDTAVEMPKGYYVYVTEMADTGALPVSAVVETTMQKAGLTYAMLAESGAELSDEYLAATLEQLSPNTTYVIAIWSQEEGSEMLSEVQCFTFRTLIDKNNRFSYTGAMLLFSRYLLVGLLGLVIILFIICTIRYSVLKKKLSGGNR